MSDKVEALKDYLACDGALKAAESSIKKSSQTLMGFLNDGPFSFKDGDQVVTVQTIGGQISVQRFPVEE